MMKVTEWLRGKKTYILVGIGLVIVGLNFAGIIEDSMTEAVLMALGLGGLATLRMAISGLRK